MGATLKRRHGYGDMATLRGGEGGSAMARGEAGLAEVDVPEVPPARLEEGATWDFPHFAAAVDALIPSGLDLSGSQAPPRKRRMLKRTRRLSLRPHFC